ncbi:MAG: hypothetical protein H6741_11995 [Alphaproteobacteria bacterium]|nr:hypothetical protein [Alphaproteobacteria bacterium]MCB9793434.1 hypothetical protein [Alphaproteobacteria bacterium]
MKELLLSKRTLLGAGITGAVAFLLAVLVNQALGRFVLPLPDGAEVDVSDISAPMADAGGEDEAGPRPRAASRRTPRRVDYVGDILARNIFDSSALGQVPGPGGGPDALTDLNLKLIATIVADPSTYSSALISGDGRNDKAFGYGIDDRITGTDAVVVSIEQKRVQIKRSNGDLEYLEMGGDDKPKPSPGKGGERAPTGDEEGISQEGGKTIVERSVVDDALNNVDKLAGQIRAVPHKGPDGEIDGFRLSAIRRGTLFDKLGIKNGDIVHAVNGMPLTSTEGALSAYQTLSSSAEFSFDVTRRNSRQTFDYEIR